jgi:PAS domain S-box-containing protein
VNHETRVILLEAAPLLLLAVLYLGVALALVPQLLSARRFSLLGLAVWSLLVFVGALAATTGIAKVGDDDFLGGIDPWPVFALTILAYVPVLILVARWSERSLLVTAGRRVSEAEEQATKRRREAEAISELSAALTRTITGQEAADHLFDVLSDRLTVDASLLALVHDDDRRIRGFAARGVDESWWRSVTLDLEHDAGALVTVARERAGYSVYDVRTAPNINRALAERVGARSAAFIPLISEGRVAGVLVAAAFEPRLFSTTELELMQDLANETALALSRTRSDEALAAALARERLVAEISLKVRSELDLETVLNVAVEEVGRAVGVDRCFIRLGEPGQVMPIVAEWEAPGVMAVRDFAERLPASNLAARERRTVAVGDTMTAAELDDPSLGGRETLVVDLGTRAVLATPIVVFDEVIGVFGLHRPSPGSWGAGEISLAEAAAREVGLAIHTARLLHENTRRIEQQTALLKAAQVLTSDLRFDAVIRRLVDEVVSLLGADAADCWIFDPERRLLRCRAVLGVPERNVGREIAPQGTFAQAIETGKPTMKRNFAATESPPPSEDYADFAEVMDAPITWLGEVRGILGVCSRDGGRFDDADLELLDTFARLASLALHNAESFGERERQAQVQRGFYRIAEVLGSTLSLAETLDAFAQAACDALGGAAALVLEPHGERLVVTGSHEVPAALESALADGLPETSSPFGAAAREERIVAAPALGDDDRFSESLRTLFTEVGYRAVLCAPVAGAHGERNAVVVLFAGERLFSDDDLALARHLTRAARGAIERAELFEGERRGRTFSQRLADVSGLLATKLDPAAAFEDVVRQAPALLEADAAVLRLLDDDELVIRAAFGPGTQGAVGRRSSSAAGVVGVAAQSRSPVALAEAAETARFAREDPLLGNGMTACVAVPMIAHGGGLYGVLAVYARSARRWGDDEVQALVALGATASAALSSAELYQRVAEEKERSEAILAHIADGIVAVDREESIVLWNAMAEQITGVPAAEALGRRVPDVLQRELSDGGDEPPGERQLAILRGGKEVWLSLTEAVMLDATGGVAGRIFAFRDISGERVVDQMKSDFVATVSHELRTPLTSIYGFAETLLRGDVAFSEAERATFLAYIASESERLINIVDDLLNVARLETGTLGLTLDPTDVAEVVGEVVERASHGNGDHRFELDLPEAEMAVEADRDKLVQIVQNLVDNALKFSPEGGRITISARRRSDTAEIRVEDEGIGISRADQGRIFTKFYRAEGVSRAGVSGTGIGLFLARGLVAAMGGRMWVESEEGEGARFIFELPIAKGKPAEKPIETASA